ncbi:hypothetical protein [Salinigranum sp.]|uniref:hypothetical protein n=1 Tax=Salinigranum sp. TaxID=1966351 RepID=UPI0035639229
MTVNDVADLVDLSMRDPAFAQKFNANPDAVLDEIEHDLDESEQQILTDGDQEAIKEEILEKKSFWAISIAGIVI